MSQCPRCGLFGRHRLQFLLFQELIQRVDRLVDIRDLPFEDASFDVVFASHVLEHVDDDHRGVAEVRRVLRPGRMAVLPVPVVSPMTIEYPEPNPHEFGHVRASGPACWARYEAHFSSVEVWRSDQFDPAHQLYTYEDRSPYPTAESPHRVAMEGEKHLDYVPVCFV